MIKRILIGLVFTSFFSTAFANEGMWILPSLPDSIVKKMDFLGYELKVRDMYSEKRNSLKDIVVYFSNGYSGTIVSSDGLLLTNYTTIQSFINNIPEANQYNEEGFLASSYTREIPIENLAISILKSTENVSNKIRSHIPQFGTLENKQAIIDSIAQVLIREKQTSTNYIVEFKASNKNTQFHLYTYERFNDIRLVYVPPVSVALFGEEKDKGSTPKHNANFALFRIYVSQENQPNTYSPFNKPYTTETQRKATGLCIFGSFGVLCVSVVQVSYFKYRKDSPCNWPRRSMASSLGACAAGSNQLRLRIACNRAGS